MIKKYSQKWVTVLILIIVAIASNALEDFLSKEGMELRTVTQVIKGFYVWLIMPGYCAWLIYSVCRKESENSKPARTVAKIMIVLVMLFILIISAIRGIFYLFSSECKQEKSLGNGILRVTESDWDMSEVYYDETVLFFFRRPFPGYTKEEVISQIQTRYGDSVKLIDSENDRYRFIATIENPVSGEITFQVKNDYPLDSDYEEQVKYFLGNSFFETKNRTFKWLESKADVGSRYTLLIPCFGRDDLDFFCGDVTELIQYYLQNETMKKNPNVFDNIGINMDGEQKQLNIRQYIEPYDNTALYNYIYQEVEEWMNNKNEMMAVEDDLPEEDTSEEQNGEITEEQIQYFLDMEPDCTFTTEEGLEYRLLAVDRATGSSYYCMIATRDGGDTCEFVVADPFNGNGGEARWLTFIDNTLGFAELSYSGGSKGMLFRTQDGGKSFTEIEYPSPQIELPDGTYYNPFVIPDKVYQKDGILYLEAGQGPDGDYKGGDGICSGLYQSDNAGKTWSYVKELNKE